MQATAGLRGCLQRREPTGKPTFPLRASDRREAVGCFTSSDEPPEDEGPEKGAEPGDE